MLSSPGGRAQRRGHCSSSRSIRSSGQRQRRDPEHDRHGCRAPRAAPAPSPAGVGATPGARRPGAARTRRAWVRGLRSRAPPPRRSRPRPGARDPLAQRSGARRGGRGRRTGPTPAPFPPPEARPARAATGRGRRPRAIEQHRVPLDDFLAHDVRPHVRLASQSGPLLGRAVPRHPQPGSRGRPWPDAAADSARGSGAAAATPPSPR